MQVNFGAENKSKGDSGRVITLFLSLYLVVLAFFILLVSISSTEEVKSKALMESLTSTFSSVLPPRMDLQAFNATTGEFLAADEFQRQVTGLFSTVVGVVKVDVIQPGRIMRVEVDGNSLFMQDQAVVREGQYPFMDRLVAALSANPPGLRFEMEFVISTSWSDEMTLPMEQTLPVRRAGAFARELLTRGAPPGSVSIGLKGGESDTIEIWFHIRATEENRIRFEESPLLKGEIQAPVVEAPAPVAPVTLQPVVRTPSQVIQPLPSPQDLPSSARDNAAPNGPVPLSLRPQNDGEEGRP